MNKLVRLSILVIFAIQPSMGLAVDGIDDFGIKYDNDAPHYEFDTNIPFTTWNQGVGGLGSNVYSDLVSAVTATDATGTWFVANINAHFYDSNAGSPGAGMLRISLFHRWAHDLDILAATDWVEIGANAILYDGGADPVFDERDSRTLHYPQSGWEYRVLQWKLAMTNYTDWVEIDPTPTPFSEATSVRVWMGESPTPTFTPTNTPVPPTPTPVPPTPTNTPIPTPTYGLGDGDYWLNIQHPSRGLAFAGNILGVTHEWNPLPSVNGVTLEGINIRFPVGTVIRSATEFYWLREIGGVREWVSFNANIVQGLDNDTLTTQPSGLVDTATNPIRIDTELAQPPFQIAPNPWGIWVEGLNVDQLDNYEAEDIVSEFIWDHIYPADETIELVSSTRNGKNQVGIKAYAPTPTNTPIPTPSPTPVLTGSGAAGVTPIEGGYNIDVPTVVPTGTFTPTPTNTPIPTPSPTPVLTGSGAAGVTPVEGGYNIDVPTAVSTQVIPTPLPTATPIDFIAGANISIATIEGGYVFSAIIPDASYHIQVLGGDDTFTIAHNFGVQFPDINYYRLSTGQRLHQVDTVCGDINYATAYFSSVMDASYAIAVASFGSGGTGGSTVINVTQEYSLMPTPITITGSGAAGVTPVGGGYNIDVPTVAPTGTFTPTPTNTPIPTPSPTPVLTGSGAAGVTPVSGGYNIDVPTVVPTGTNTPTPTNTPIPTPSLTPTFTPTFTPTSTPTPPKINQDLGDGVNTEFSIYTDFSGPALAQGIINSTSKVLNLGYRNVAANEIAVSLSAPMPFNELRVVTARADAWQVFGDTGESEFTIDPNCDGRFTICAIQQAGGSRWIFDPAEIQYTDNSTTEIVCSAPAGLMQANFLIASGTKVIGNGSATSFLINTGLTHREAIVQIFEAGGDHRVLWGIDVIHSSTSQITVTFPSAPSANQYIVAWADAHEVPEDLDSRYVMLNGSNRMLARGDHFNGKVKLHAKQVIADEGLDLITDGGLRLWDGGLVCGAFGYKQNNYFKFSPDYYFSIQAGAFERIRITVDEIQLKTDTTVDGDVTADKYYGDVADAGFGLDKTIDVYGRTVFSLKTPTPTLTPTVTPTFTPTPTATTVPPTPTFQGIRRTDDILETSGQEWDLNGGKWMNNSVVESTTFRFKVVTVATEAELLATIHNGDMVCWMPGGSILARADLQIKFAEDTEGYYLCVTYNASAGALAGVTERQKLTPFDDRNPEHTYLGAVRLDDKIYLIQVWNNG